MSKYVLDTNVYIAAGRDPTFGHALQQFTAENLPSIHLHAVVVQEILAGAVDAQRERFTNRTLITPFERRGRVLTPTYRDWRRAGEIMARLVQRRLLSPGGFTRSFPHDCVLAASCRAAGVTLISNNLRDFEVIQKVEPVEVVPPWPN